MIDSNLLDFAYRTLENTYLLDLLTDNYNFSEIKLHTMLNIRHRTGTIWYGTIPARYGIVPQFDRRTTPRKRPFAGIEPALA
jgi:hypothetical protein